jgi:putative glutamine amidotransferase
MKSILTILAITFLITSCTKEMQEQNIKIAISKSSGSENYKRYGSWLKSADSSIEYVDLFHIPFDSAVKIMSVIDGLMLSGGPDVHPFYFNKTEDTARCSIDDKRDTLEFELIKIALKRKIPILAICRGEQILNVALGGSLIIDIPSDTKSRIIHKADSGVPVHEISINKNSYLYKISNVEKTIVNSYHHQAVDKLADDFYVTGTTSDGIIESFEYKDWKNKPFLIAIQWHPERLNPEHPMSLPIAKEFINSIKKNKNKIL